ncbi:MAG: hypothetical protein AAF253_14740 [Pseudomonadota bacterium]
MAETSFGFGTTGKKEGSTMYALIAIGAVFALFAILNIIDFKRLD